MESPTIVIRLFDKIQGNGLFHFAKKRIINGFFRLRFNNFPVKMRY